MEQKCTQCKTTKPLQDFAKARGKGYSPRCDVCRASTAAVSRQWYADRADIVTTRRCYVYKMTEEEYVALKAKHDGHCAICNDEVPLVVDHCHETGAVRGLLCNPCNTGLGMFRDDPERLILASRYISS